MVSGTPDRLERNASADLWRNTLLQIPTVFGRLVHLAGLRNPVTGKYEHHGLALVFGEVEARKALRKSHAQTFAEWLSFDLEKQKADLDLYFSCLEAEKPAIVKNWLELKTYKTFVPNSATAAEKRLYTTDIEALIALLKNEYGDGGPDREA